MFDGVWPSDSALSVHLCSPGGLRKCVAGAVDLRSVADSGLRVRLDGEFFSAFDAAVLSTWTTPRASCAGSNTNILPRAPGDIHSAESAPRENLMQIPQLAVDFAPVGCYGVAGRGRQFKYSRFLPSRCILTVHDDSVA